MIYFFLVEFYVMSSLSEFLFDQTFSERYTAHSLSQEIPDLRMADATFSDQPKHNRAIAIAISSAMYKPYSVV